VTRTAARFVLVAASFAASCGTEPAAVDAQTGDADVGDGGLPCEVRDVLATACAHCHASPPKAGADMPLLSRRDFFAPSRVDGENIGARVLARLHHVDDPMPPLSEPRLGPLADVLASWITAGMPAGSCESLPVSPVPTTCASNDYWTGGSEQPDEDMNPGVACLQCHLDYGGNRAFPFSGTVFSSFHEKSMCNSPPPPGARIEILDEAGQITLTMLPSASGNFHSTLAPGVPLPYRARLVANGRVREMQTLQMSGDCNACHSEQGGRQLPTDEHEAPGRVVWP